MGETRDRRVPGRFPVGRGERGRDLPCEAVTKTAGRLKNTGLNFVEYILVDSVPREDHCCGGGCSILVSVSLSLAVVAGLVGEWETG